MVNYKNGFQTRKPFFYFIYITIVKITGEGLNPLKGNAYKKDFNTIVEQIKG